MCTQGDLEQAHRTLANRGTGARAARVEQGPLRTAYCAIIRHQQWWVMGRGRQPRHAR